MSTKFSEFLSSKGIDARRLVSASKEIEKHQADDKALVAKKKAMKEGKLEKDAEVQKQKPRSGRPVTMPSLTKAMTGRPVTGATKTRIVRAVNAVLAQKKKGEATLKDLF